MWWDFHYLKYSQYEKRMGGPEGMWANSNRMCESRLSGKEKGPRGHLTLDKCCAPTWSCTHCSDFFSLSFSFLLNLPPAKGENCTLWLSLFKISIISLNTLQALVQRNLVFSQSHSGWCRSNSPITWTLRFDFIFMGLLYKATIVY